MACAIHHSQHSWKVVRGVKTGEEARLRFLELLLAEAATAVSVEEELLLAEAATAVSVEEELLLAEAATAADFVE